MRVACIWFSKPVATSKLAEHFLRFSPQIAIRAERAIFIEIGKSLSLYSEPSFIARAQIILRRQGLAAKIAIGSDVTDSLTLAKFGVPSVDRLPLEALIDIADPFGRNQDQRKSIQNLINSFQDLGITSIGQFKQLPIGELVARFNILGRFLHLRANLQDFIEWPLWVPEEIILEKKEFLHPEYQGNLEPIMFELKTQLDSIFARLRSRNKRMTKLEVQIKCEKLSINLEPLRIFNFEFFAPQSSSKSTLKILMERLNKEFEKKPLKSSVESIQSKVIRTVQFAVGQKNLLNHDEEKFEEIHSIHNQLVEILGKENVFQVCLTEDRRPERSWVKDFSAPHENSDSNIELTDVIPERSTYLCRVPIKIEVTAGYIHIKKRRYKILHWDNKIEKISGGWFEKPVEEIKDSFDRTYNSVIIEGYQRISVFETKTREFYLHGYYG